MGRSYGDSANAIKVLQTSNCDHYLGFNNETGILTAEAGITLREILKVIVPRGWFTSNAWYKLCDVRRSNR